MGRARFKGRPAHLANVEMDILGDRRCFWFSYKASEKVDSAEVAKEEGYK